MEQELLKQREFLLKQLFVELNWSYDKRESKVDEINKQIKIIDELLEKVSRK